MCGRFTQYSSLEIVQETFAIQTVTCDIGPGYNIAPSQEVIAVIDHEGYRLGKLHWGLVPFWAKDLSGAARHINARLETLADKPLFRNAFHKRRCLIVADGFYEWQVVGKRKQPWYFFLSSKKPFGFAGLWEKWERDDGTPYYSCTIITTESSPSVRPVHHRMPLILKTEVIREWLDPRITNAGQLYEILHKGTVKNLEGYPVTTFVNSVKNNGPECIKPLFDKVPASEVLTH